MAEEPKDKGCSPPPARPAEGGAAVIEGYLQTLENRPGVYRMIGAGGRLLYVGKAKNLKKRVANYTKAHRQPMRILRMVHETEAMEFVTTETEAEALLLEANLIKRLKPRYNILLRDDKSFPEILVGADHPFPRVLKHRGAHATKGEYFGPFADVRAVNETLEVLQRAFLLRTCTDSVFSARTRPCLLYQIKRCSAPCVDKIAASAYGELVEQARSFLRGRSQDIQRHLARRMQAESDALAFERAAQYRDRLQALTRIQARQDINPGTLTDADVIAVHQSDGLNCIQVFFFRGGRNFGNRPYYPTQAADDPPPVVLEAFIGQFYDDRPPPPLVLLNCVLPSQGVMADALSVKAGRKIRLICPRRGDRLRLVGHALNNAREALARRVGESAAQKKLLEGVRRVFALDSIPERIEVYDNSHSAGRQAVGGMIVAGPEGFLKKAYRKFTIRDDKIVPGDDYAMMREVLTRRFVRARKEDPARSRGEWPDLVLIDGGAGQLSVARAVLEDLGIGDVAIVGIAKGPDRNAGRERIFMIGKAPFSLPPRDPVLYFLQRLRDEAHRFAIGVHRAKRGKTMGRSVLDDVPGIGAKRKKALLHHFGAAKAVADAGREDLAQVEGISTAIADRIYDWFHRGG
ncbi:excinuclease ABC subunit UvrC [Varunaivibrio sulfuroxidans]|uniref:excinuclease ABC subunit UvrC n=1 Tax=Varunaivibrio sulfuroxidans TaxID=1773489 RepID=UPI00389AC927